MRTIDRSQVQLHRSGICLPTSVVFLRSSVYCTRAYLRQLEEVVDVGHDAEHELKQMRLLIGTVGNHARVY